MTNDEKLNTKITVTKPKNYTVFIVILNVKNKKVTKNKDNISHKLCRRRVFKTEYTKNVEMYEENIEFTDFASCRQSP